MIRPQQFCVEPPSKMEPWHNQRRFHQEGISGGTNVDVPQLFWRMKPSRAGESWLQCDASTDRRHTDVSVITAMQHWRESSSKWPFISHKKGTKNGMNYSRSPLFNLQSHLMALGAAQWTRHRDNTEIISKLSHLKSENMTAGNWSLFWHDPSLPAQPQTPLSSIRVWRSDLFQTWSHSVCISGHPCLSLGGSQALAYINIRSHKENLKLGVINCWMFYFTIKVGNFTHCVAEKIKSNGNYTA